MARLFDRRGAVSGWLAVSLLAGAVTARAEDAVDAGPVATVVRAHPRLTRGLARESLIGIRFDNSYGGANSDLNLKLSFTNCTHAAVSDLRLWRQSFNQPYAFYEAQATAIGSTLATNGIADAELRVAFTGCATHIYPCVGTRADSDYLWVTATIDPEIPPEAEIWVSVENTTISLGTSVYAVTNGTARAPHRVFPYKYQIGAYLRQDRITAESAGRLEDRPEMRLGNLTDVIVINDMQVKYDEQAGSFSTSWNDERDDSGAAERVRELRDRYHGKCMVRAGLTKGAATITANGITAYPIACAAANADSRRQLVSEIMAILEANHLDGLDIDWEYPGDGSGGTAIMITRDWGYYGLLLRDLAAAFFDKGYVLSLCTNLGYAMPNDESVYGALHAADYIDSMAYGNTTLNASPQVMQTAIAVCESRGVPARRIVVGQAIYAYEGWNPGWNTVAGWLKSAYPDDPFRRWDADMIWMKRNFTGEKWVWKETFEGPSSYHAKLNWCRANGYGGVMSWGYYTDVDWDDADLMSLARHQSKAMWPISRYTPAEPEKIETEDGQTVYLLDSEEDWSWLRDHPDVRARFKSDIELLHDPLPIAQWKGVLDGDGHVLTIPRDTWLCYDGDAALIGQLDGTVKNLTIDLYGRVVSRASRWNDTAVVNGTQPSVVMEAEPGDYEHSTANTMTTPLSDHYVAVLAGKARWGTLVDNVRLIVREGAEIQGPSRTAGLIADMYCAAGNNCILRNSAVQVDGTIHSVARNTAETDLNFEGVAVGPLVAYANAPEGANVQIANSTALVSGRVAAETGSSPAVNQTIGRVNGAHVQASALVSLTDFTPQIVLEDGAFRIETDDPLPFVKPTVVYLDETFAPAEEKPVEFGQPIPAPDTPRNPTLLKFRLGL
ncbi:MAG: glycoside hydrolase family 18 protein [Kiritimatiellia bacterium]